MMGLGLVLGAGVAGAGPSSGAATPKKYKIVLINHYLGNDWRPVMMKSAEVLAKKAPLKSRVASLRLINTENTPAAESAAIESAILEKPDLILALAASPTAVNSAFKRACAAGITVITFDSLATEPCVWKHGVPFPELGTAWATWLMNQIGGKGTIFRDMGLEGAAPSAQWNKTINAVLKKYPNVKQRTYWGRFACGDETSAVTQLLTGTPDVVGVLSAADGGCAIRVFARQGRKPVPTTGWSYNRPLAECEKGNVPCLLASSPTWISGSAMRLGIDILDGKIKGKPRFIPLHAPMYTNTKTAFVNKVGPRRPIKGVALPGYAEGLSLPLSPPWAKLTPGEVVKR
jgi:ribose transport system substrate-binding protein